ncbi:MAG: addiction module protein [Pirellulales bacterium]
MSQAADFSHVLAAALALPSDERESLVGKLNDSLHNELRETVGDAGITEIRERIRRFHDGESQAWTIEEVAAEVRRRRDA